MYVFDLDGTLVDSVDTHAEAWLEAARRLGIKTTRDEVRPLMGLPAPRIGEILAGPRAAELVELKKRLFLEVFVGRVKPFEDAAVLAQLPRPIAVVSSTNGVVVRAVLNVTGLVRYVDFAIGGDEVTRGKPHPDPLYLVAGKFGVDVKKMVVVGDSRYDMEMALAAGARAVCIARSGPSCHPNAEVIKTLWELAR